MKKIFTLLLFTSVWNLYAQSGHTLNGVGARGFGMAGIGTSYSSSPGNALIWNPSNITDLPTSVELSTSIISLNTTNYSELDLSLLNPMLPAGSVAAGDLSDETKNTFLPTLSFVYNPDNKWSFGLSAAGIGGFGVDFPANNESPLSLLFGDIKSEYRLFQISVAAAYKFSDKLSVAIAPTINLASLELAPITTTTPTIVGGQLVYPQGDKANSTGYGIHVGLTYMPKEDWIIGLMYKSRQEFEAFEYDRQNGIGALASTDLDYPMIIAGGIAYTGFSKTVVAFDYRRIHFSSTDGLSGVGYGSDLSVQGFGWSDSNFYGIGIERSLSDAFKLTSGYSYNTSPIADEISFFSIPAPAVVQHAVGFGLVYSISDRIDVSTGVHHGFRESTKGPIIVPSQNGDLALPSLVESSLSTTVFSLDVGLKL